MTLIRPILLPCLELPGYVEQLPSGSWRARVYAGVDTITQREIRLKATAKTEQQPYIELGRLLKEASEGRTPEIGATMAKLLDEYAAIAPSGTCPTRQTNEGFIRRTIKPALGHLQVRKVRGPDPRQAVRGAEALWRPVLHRQAVHRAPQRPGPGDQPARPLPGLAAGH